MAFDGLVTHAIVSELSHNLTLGKIEKIYQPEAEELVFIIHTKAGNKKLYMSCASSHARVHLTDENFENPASPMAFCMLMRKHLSGGRIQKITQKETERIIEFDIETMNELGFSVNKRLIIEIMGKHSNIVLIDIASGKIIDCIKRVSIDVNRIRQLLPGKIYEYPPAQDKIPFFDITLEKLTPLCEVHPDMLAKSLLSGIQGISPAVAESLAFEASASTNALHDTNQNHDMSIDVCANIESANSLQNYARNIMQEIDIIQKALISQSGLIFQPIIYFDESGAPLDFHALRLAHLDGLCEHKTFDSISTATEFYFQSKSNTNRVKQKTSDLSRAIKSYLDKLYLKKQRLSEDILKAENSENLRLYGELINANLYNIPQGAKSVKLLNYYDGSEIEIPLDVRYSASKNAQIYFKKYGKSKTAIKEKASQLEETDMDISYLESALVFADNATSIEQTEAIRAELVEGGYLRHRKNAFSPKALKSKPLEFKILDKYRLLVGKNNKENDILTFKTASSKDLWFHTKDIPGSHVILFTDGKAIDELEDEAIYTAASVAAYHSKGRSSENVPVDYVPVRYVKKPAGAKPGMVIFTNNRTVYVNPKLPNTK